MRFSKPESMLVGDVLKQLVPLIDTLPSNPKTSAFATCFEKTAKTKERCKRRISKNAVEKAEKYHTRLLRQKICSETEEFYDELKLFLTLTHCYQHIKEALKRLEEKYGSQFETAANDNEKSDQGDKEESNQISYPQTPQRQFFNERNKSKWSPSITPKSEIYSVFDTDSVFEGREHRIPFTLTIPKLSGTLAHLRHFLSRPLRKMRIIG